MVAGLKLRPARKVIISETGNFPTDVYVSARVAEMQGAALRCVAPDQVQAAIAEAGADFALVHLTQVNCKTGLIHDMNAITRAAMRRAVWRSGILPTARARWRWTLPPPMPISPWGAAINT